MRARLLCLLTLWASLTGGLLVAAAPALAEAPLQQGWWTAANSGALSASVPQPDVPKDGLLVQGGLNSPTAYAALVYDVSGQVEPGQLTLRIAQGSGTVPGATLELCALRQPAILAEQGGPMADAPGYTCSKKTTAKPDAKGTTYRFTVSPLVSRGALAVAILPLDPSTRVVLTKPGAASLAIQTHSPGTPSPQPSPTPGSTPSTVPSPSSGDTAAPPSGGGGFAAGPPGLSSGSGAPSSAPQPAPSVAPAPAPAQPAPSTVRAAAIATNGDGTNAPAVLGVLGALALATILWAYAGSSRIETPVDGV